jgi:hypothetical protein
MVEMAMGDENGRNAVEQVLALFRREQRIAVEPRIDQQHLSRDLQPDARMSKPRVFHEKTLPDTGRGELIPARPSQGKGRSSRPAFDLVSDVSAR